MVNLASFNDDELHRFSDNYRSALASISASVNSSMLPALQSISAMQSYFSTALKQVTSVQSQMYEALSSVSMHQMRMSEHLQSAFQIANQQRELLKSFERVYKLPTPLIDSASFSRLTSSIGLIFAEENIRNIDFSGLDQFDPNDAPSGSDVIVNLTGTSAVTVNAEASIEVGNVKKKLIEMDEDDLRKIIAKSLKTAGVLSFAHFIYTVYADYVNDAARVILEVVLAFMVTTLTGHYNAEVKQTIYETIQDSKTVTDARKVITKYIKVNPTDQIGFLRNSEFLRKGATRKSPFATKEKISTKTVLTIKERRNNWVKVEIDSGDLSGEMGWIEESKVIKFKKM